MPRMVSSAGHGIFRYPANTTGAFWAPLKLGAGGFVRNIDVSNDGTLVCQTDVYGGYIYNSTLPNPGNAGGTGVWQQLVNTTSIPTSDPTSSFQMRNSTFGGNQGIYSLAIAPSDSNRLYMGYLGYMYVSYNKGANWTSFPTWAQVDLNAMPANDQTSPNWFGQCGPKISIDPIKPDIAFFCTQTGGLFQTTNAGLTYSAVSGVSTPSTGGVFTCYDRRGTTQSGGISQVIYAFSYGVGCYKSSDAGANWTKISGSSTGTTALLTCRRMVVDTSGNLWLTDDTQSASNLWKYNGTSFTNVSFGSFVNNGSTYHSIAFDPTVASSQRIILGAIDGVLTQSNDGGTTWFGAFQNLNGDGGHVSTDIPYLDGISDRPLNGNMVFLPGSTTIWWASGVGVWTAAPTTSSSTSFNWSDASSGIEELVMNQVISPPGGNPICLAWDRPEFTSVDKRKYPTSYQPGSFVFPPGGSSGCYVPGTPSTTFFQANNILFKSIDNGVTWTTKSGVPSNGAGGGCLAALTSSILVFVEHSGGNPQYTNNGGTTWNDLGSYFTTNFTLPAGTGWNAAGTYISNDQIACSDGTAIFLYNTDATHGGIFRSTDGANWTKQSAIGGTNHLPDPLSVGGGNPIMIAVPGKTGHLLVTNGRGYEPDNQRPQSTQQLWMSTDAGVTWTAVSNVQEPWVIGAGVQVGSYPTIAFMGWYNSAPGVWVSHDQGSTFRKVGELTMEGTWDVPKCMCVDNNHADTIYVGKTGSGVSRYGT